MRSNQVSKKDIISHFLVLYTLLRIVSGVLKCFINPTKT
eukprot:UN17988